MDPCTAASGASHTELFHTELVALLTAARSSIAAEVSVATVPTVTSSLIRLILGEIFGVCQLIRTGAFQGNAQAFMKEAVDRLVKAVATVESAEYASQLFAKAVLDFYALYDTSDLAGNTALGAMFAASRGSVSTKETSFDETNQCI